MKLPRGKATLAVADIADVGLHSQDRDRPPPPRRFHRRPSAMVDRSAGQAGRGYKRLYTKAVSLAEIGQAAYGVKFPCVNFPGIQGAGKDCLHPSTNA